MEHSLQEPPVAREWGLGRGVCTEQNGVRVLALPLGTGHLGA